MIFEGQSILVTGGTGSLGKVLIRRILSGELGTPEKVIVFSRDEAKQHDMRMAYLNKQVTSDAVIYNNFRRILEFRIGDVRDYASLRAAVRDAQIIINAAALKQVPTCEYFPHQAVLTNVIGANNLVQAVLEGNCKTHTVVGVSTDKACKPVNAMGMTKAMQERILIAANIFSKSVRFIGVRYGNVMASRGSVIPLFHQQIATQGAVTVTVPEMTRFLLSIDQAVDTVFAALQHARPGEIYIPRAPSAQVIDLARALIGERPIPIQIIGIRPGEKIHEILISEEECHHAVERGDYYAILPMLPELRQDDQKMAGLAKEFSSADTVLSPEGTLRLLREHRLMVGDAPLAEGGELLR